MAGFVILSPLHGWAAPLAEVPDPVFAEGMMGDGAAIDPLEGRLFAPCAGVVIQLHRARHALTIRTAGGLEVLVHLGLETVALGGEGFTVHVREGEAVVAGQPLIDFDLDLLARRVRSLVSPVLITNPEGHALVRRRLGCVVEVGEPLFEVEALSASAERPAGVAAEGPAVSRTVRITHAHGLHARPAALIAAEVKRLGLPIQIGLGERLANARSPVAMMGLGARPGDELVFHARGAGAEAALDALEAIVQRINAAPAPEPPTAEPRTARRLAQGEIQGVRAAPGLAVGPAFRLVEAALVLPDDSRPAPTQLQALQQALAVVEAELERRAAAAQGPAREIIAAHLELLDDPELIEAAGRGGSPAAAWRAALQSQIARLRGLGEPRLAERIADLADLERQVLLALGCAAADQAPPPPGAIVLAGDLAPSQISALQDAGVAGICTARGGPTSHVAILAAAAGLPAIVAAGEAVLMIADGHVLVLDADAGALHTAASPAEIRTAEARAAAIAAGRRTALAAAQAPCRMADGQRIEIFANVGSLADARAAVDNGAEGCGLLRTEFLFLDRDKAPSEEEQTAEYQAIAAAFDGRPVIVRTLDVGADKPAPYIPLPPAANPALGLRGVRIGLRQPALLEAQLRAILRLQPEDQCRIMLPMVSSLAELTAVRRMAEAAARQIGREAPFQLGVMIETPAAAVTAELIAAEADFLSIGSNDLAQYALAMDRGDPALAAEVDALHPAVLLLIGMTVDGARAHGVPVGVCGALASDPLAAPILIGLGVSELSASPAAVPELKALVRTLTLDACHDLAVRACAQASAAAVRALRPGAGEEAVSRGARR